MKPESISEPADPRAAATAYALDELSAEERIAFEKQIESDPDLASLAGETKEFCGLLGSSLQRPTVELQQAARSRLLFEADKRNRTAIVVRHKWMRRITAAAACLVAGSGGTYWWLDSSGRLESRYADRTTFQVNQSSAPDVFASPGNEQLAQLAPSAGERARTDALRTASLVTMPAAAAPASNLASTSGPSPAVLPNVSSPPADTTMTVSGVQMSSYAMSGGGLGGGRGTGRGTGLGDGYGTVAGRGYLSARQPAAPAPAKAVLDHSGMAREIPSDWDKNPNLYTDLNRPVRPEGFPGTESYKAMAENPFRGVLREPLSTFSIDVDTASYSNVRRFLNMGQAPPPEAVRLEELVNYFPYDYAHPVDGKPFAVHVEMASAPWNEHHRLARIALKGKDVAQGERPAANLVFLVDVSGSMQPENRLPLVKQSLKFVVERLTDKDTVSMVTYAGESGVALPATNGADKARILAAINGLGAGGSTNGAGGITTAYAQAAMHFNKEGINRVILATDGDFNVGVTSEEELLNLITEKAKTGVFLSVLGYGYGNTKDDRMEMLADKGNGNYAYIDSLSEARKSLADQFNGTLVTIAKDVKIQIEFNPAIIRGYRLLGYENRMLAKEDFNNDKKDAGEIGAGHTVTALYELIPVNAPIEAITTVDGLKYQPKPEAAAPPPAAVEPAANASGETMTVKLRWKAPDADQSQLMEVPVKDSGAKINEASAETRWAVAVAGFAALLNNSQHSGLSWEAVRDLARRSKGADPNGYRGEFLQLINKAGSVRR